MTVVVFINMREKFERVLNKIVVPMNDRLSGVEVSQMGMGEIYKVTFLINDRIDYRDGFNIENETRSLFHMLSPNKGEDYIVQYKMVEE